MQVENESSSCVKGIRACYSLAIVLPFFFCCCRCCTLSQQLNNSVTSGGGHSLSPSIYFGFQTTAQNSFHSHFTADVYQIECPSHDEISPFHRSFLQEYFSETFEPGRITRQVSNPNPKRIFTIFSCIDPQRMTKNLNNHRGSHKDQPDIEKCWS